MKVDLSLSAPYSPHITYSFLVTVITTENDPALAFLNEDPDTQVNKIEATVKSIKDNNMLTICFSTPMKVPTNPDIIKTYSALTVTINPIEADAYQCTNLKQWKVQSYSSNCIVLVLIVELCPSMVSYLSHFNTIRFLNK